MPLSVDIDRLGTLLARAAESDDLDFKSTWDPKHKHDLVELCKDIGAMESLTDGGYLIVGADDHGAASGTFSPADTSDFDEQKIRSRLASVLGEPIDLSCALHDLDGDSYLIIGVGPNRNGMRIMPKDGEYPGKTVWRAGDVFVRRGTSSVRWSQHEAHGIIGRVVAARKEEWRRDVFDTIRAATPAYEAGGFVNINVEMPGDSFVAAVTELVRRKDDVGLDLLTRKTIGAAAAAIEAIGSDTDLSAVAAELGDHLERLDILAVLGARYAPAVFLQAREGYRQVYAAIDDDPDHDYPFRFPQGHKEVLMHLYAVGADLVEEKRWAPLGELARLTPVNTGNGYWRSLLGKAEVMTARGNLLQDNEGARVGVIEAAKPATARLFELLGETRTRELTNLLVEFDVYRGIATSHDNKIGGYTNFALYYSRRAEPAFLTVLEDPAAREALFSGTDEQLAKLYAQMNSAATREAFSYNGWDGFNEPRLLSFVDGADE